MSENLHVCEVCGASVSELRRGRCWGCYGRWVDARPVGSGAKCITCSEKRRKVLRGVELFGGWKPMCFNCAGQLLDLNPMPETIAELRAIVSRERRRIDRRTLIRPDSRVFRYERRVGQRRTYREELPRFEPVHEMIDDVIIEIALDHPEPVGFEELTTIREMVTHLRRTETVVT